MSGGTPLWSKVGDPETPCPKGCGHSVHWGACEAKETPRLTGLGKWTPEWCAAIQAQADGCERGAGKPSYAEPPPSHHKDKTNDRD